MILIGFDETIEEAKATKVDTWYNPHLRLWEITRRDMEDNQIGPTEYAYGKKEAVRIAKEMEGELHEAL